MEQHLQRPRLCVGHFIKTARSNAIVASLVIAGGITLPASAVAQSITHTSEMCGESVEVPFGTSDVAAVVNGIPGIPDGSLPMNTIFGATHDPTGSEQGGARCTIPTDTSPFGNPLPSFTLNNAIAAGNNLPDQVSVTFDYSSNLNKDFRIVGGEDGLFVQNSIVYLSGNGVVDGWENDSDPGAIGFGGNPSIVYVNKDLDSAIIDDPRFVGIIVLGDIAVLDEDAGINEFTPGQNGEGVELHMYYSRLEGNFIGSNANDIGVIGQGAVVNGFLNGSEGDNELTVQDNAQINGYITAGDGDNILIVRDEATVTEGIGAGDGNNILKIQDSATVRGEIYFGEGSDHVTISGNADISDVQWLDGGDDYSSAGGMIDILTFDGWEGAVEGDIVVNWEQVILTGGTSVSFGGALTVGVDEDGVAEDEMGLFVQNGGTLVAEDEFVLTGNLNLLDGGIVELTNGTSVEDVVTINGNVIGDGGTLAFNVDFENGTGDVLVVNGDTEGAIQIAVSNQGTLGLANGETITLVDVQDGDNNATYELVGGAIEIGAWTYNLDVGQTTDLVALIAAINEIGAVYESAPTVLLSGFASLPTLEQRVGQRQWVLRGDDGPDGVWMRLHGERARITPAESDAGASLRSNTWGIQLGADVLAGESETGYWVLGVTGQYGTVSAGVTNPLGEGRIRGTVWGLGATATWHGYGGTYVDLQGLANWISARYSTAAHGALASNRRATAYALSAELGHWVAVDENSALVPQAQLSWGQVSGGSFTDSQGNDVRLGTNSRTIGRLGLAYEYRPNGMTTGQRGNDEQMVYGIVNILHDFSSPTSVDVAGTTLQSRDHRTWGEIGLGGSVEVVPNAMLYGQASYREALGSGSSDNNALSGTVGLRFQW